MSTEADVTSAAAERYADSLPGPPTLLRVDPVDRLGIPALSAHVMVDGRPVGGFGYGTTEGEAAASALGELAEWAAFALAARRRRLEAGSRRELRGRALDAVDPVTVIPDPGRPVDDDTPLVWTPATRMTDGAERWLPVELAACSRSELPAGVDPIITPITNGLGAGDNAARAHVHGLLELLQRDGNTLRHRALDTGVVLDVDACDDPDVAALLRRFRRAGLDPLVKLAGTDLGVVNVWATAVDHRPDPDLPLTVTAGGEAADPDPTRAVRKALCELAAARSRKAFCHGRRSVVERIATPAYLDDWLPHVDPGREERRALTATQAWARLPTTDLADVVSRTTRHVRTVGWDTVVPAEPPPCTHDGRRAHLLAALADAGLEALWIDASPPDGGVVAGKAVVPGLEVETMSYGRIGRRGLATAAALGHDFCGVGPIPSDGVEVALTAGDRHALGGPGWIAPARVDAVVGDLYPLYREPGRHAVLGGLDG